MRILFMGSDKIACPALQRLRAEPRHSIVAIVTQPDRPRGRSLHVAPCAVAAKAAANDAPVLKPVQVSAPEVTAAIAALTPDLIVVMAYGQILRRDLLAIPPHGCVNVHASLLPRYRGAAPAQWAIANGESVTGVTTMAMDEGMDTGDILLQAAVPILPADTAATLEERLAGEGAALLMRTLEEIEAGRARRSPQDSTSATYARKLRKDDGRVDWTRPAAEIERRVRAFNPWPYCFCRLPPATEAPGRGGLLRILHSRVEEGRGPAGRVLETAGDGPLIAAGEGALRLLAVQPEGRKVMTGRAFLQGHALQTGRRLE